MPRPQAVVVGAGIGGLVAALELARSGVDVTVVERAERPGGKLREVNVNGHSIDAGPTVFTLRSVFEDIFRAAGSSLADQLTLTPLETLARHAWSDRERLDLHADLERSMDAIGEFSGAAEAQRYRRFCERAKGVFDTLEQTFIRASRPNPLTLVKRVGITHLGDMMRIQPFSTLWRALGKEFRDPRLQQLFGRYATYMGSSPFSAPATLMLIAHVERAGVWRVTGGMYRIVEALAGLALQHGVNFRYATEVRRVVTGNRRVTGVELATDEFLKADAVIVNADAGAVAAGQLGNDISSAVPGVPRSRRSLSALTWALVARTRGFELHHHTVFFSADYAREFREIQHEARLPRDPTVYICAPDRSQQHTLVSGEAERLFCLINAPATGDSQPPDIAEIERCRERAFALLSRCGLEIDFDEQQCQITGPEQFEGLFPNTGGSLYGPASHGWQASFRRPGAQTRIPGLYLAGGSTHPGAGVPMAALSGKQAAAALMNDWNQQ